MTCNCEINDIIIVQIFFAELGKLRKIDTRLIIYVQIAKYVLYHVKGNFDS